MDQEKAISPSVLKRIFIFVGKLILWTTGVIIVLFLLLLLVIRLPYVQNQFKNKVVASVSEKLHTAVDIKHLYLNLSGQVVIKGVFLADQQRDTLCYFGEVSVGFNPMALLRKHLTITSFTVKDAFFNYSVLGPDGNSNIDFIIKAFADTAVKTKTEPSSWKIGVNTILLNTIRINYDNVADSLNMRVLIGDSKIDMPESDLTEQRVVVQSLTLRNTQGKFTTYNTVPVTPNDKKLSQNDSIQRNSEKSAMVMVIKKVILQNITFEQLDKITDAGGTYTIAQAVIIPGLLDLNNNALSFNQIDINHGKIAIRNSRQSAPSEEVKSTKTIAQQPGWNITIADFKLKLDDIKIDTITRSGMGTFISNPMFSLTHFELHAEHNEYRSDSWKSTVSNLQFLDSKTNQVTRLSLQTSFKGGLITANAFSLFTGSSFLKANGSAKISPMEKGKIPDFHLEIIASSINFRDISKYLPELPFLKEYDIPEKAQFSCNIKSKDSDITGNGIVNTPLGRVNFNARMIKAESLDNSRYALTVKAVNFDLGKLMKDSVLESLTVSVQLKGVGVDPYRMTCTTNVVLDSILTNHKVYHDLGLNGQLSAGKLHLNVFSNESAAKFQLGLNGNIQPGRSDLQIKSTINNIDPRILGFSKDTMTVSGFVSAYYNGYDSMHFKTGADTMQFHVTFPKRDIEIHNVLAYNQSGDTARAMLDSEPFKMTFIGNVKLARLATTFEQFIGKYKGVPLKNKQVQGSDFFALDVQFKNLSSVEPFLPRGMYINPQGKITALLKNGRLTADGNFKHVELGDNEFENIQFRIDGLDTTLSVSFSIASVNTPVQLVRNLLVSGEYNAGLLNSRLQFSDELGDPWFDIGFRGNIKTQDRSFTLNNSLLLNYQKWITPGDNQITYGKKGLQFKDIVIRHHDREIAFLDNSGKPEELGLEFKNLNLSQISAVWKGDSTSFTGFLNGKITTLNLLDKFKKPMFNAELDIKKITIAGLNVGEFGLTASNTANPDIANITMQLGQDTMMFSLKGDYGFTKDAPMHFNFLASNFNLISLNPFTENVISDPHGIINASMDIAGTISKPQINGYMGFNGVNFYLNSVESSFEINDQKIYVNNNSIDFSSFTIGDVDDNTMVINGNIKFRDFDNVQYDLHLDMDNFLAVNLNPEKQADKLTKALLSGNISIRGKNDLPVIRATIQTDDGSSFYYKMTKHDTDVSAKGIVEFNGAPPSKNDGSSYAVMENLDLTANITLTEKTPVSILTDPARNMGLTLKAGGILSLRQLPGQSPNLTGQVNISGGNYTLALSGIKRTLAISDSSSISWTGDMTDPELNLKAYYKVNSPSAPIMPPSEDEKYLTAIPFLVNMIIQGQLSQPTFKFQLTLPAEYESNYGDVAAALQIMNSDENEVNRNAVMLLLFGSFGFNNIANIINNGSGGTNALISTALNQVASQMVTFVDLHFDLQSFDNYGGTTGDNLRTDMKVSVAKKFMKNRLLTQVGGTFVLQGDEQEQNKPLWDKIVPEFNVEYILDKQKIWKVKGFRQSEYRGIVEGKVISLGTGIVFEKNYEKPKDLFRKKIVKKQSVTQLLNIKK